MLVTSSAPGKRCSVSPKCWPSTLALPSHSWHLTCFIWLFNCSVLKTRKSDPGFFSSSELKPEAAIVFPFTRTKLYSTWARETLQSKNNYVFQGVRFKLQHITGQLLCCWPPQEDVIKRGTIMRILCVFIQSSSDSIAVWAHDGAVWVISCAVKHYVLLLYPVKD